MLFPSVFKFESVEKIIISLLASEQSRFSSSSILQFSFFKSNETLMMAGCLPARVRNVTQQDFKEKARGMGTKSISR